MKEIREQIKVLRASAALIDDRNPNGELEEITTAMRVIALKMEKSLDQCILIRKDDVPLELAVALDEYGTYGLRLREFHIEALIKTARLVQEAMND